MIKGGSVVFNLRHVQTLFHFVSPKESIETNPVVQFLRMKRGMETLGKSGAFSFVWFFATLSAFLLSPIAESFAPSSEPISSASISNRNVSNQSFLAISLDRNQEDGDVAFGSNNQGVSNRRSAMGRMFLAPPLVATTTAGTLTAPPLALASGEKQTNLSDEDLIKIVVDKDLIENQFLVNGKLTRSIYDESCTFQDEIDTYGLEQWMSGTAKLFDGDRSRVVVAPGSVKIGKNPTKDGRLLEFRFVEYLCFNIPLVKPIVFLSGTLFLEVSDTTGLITSYREKWDQDIYKVLTSESKPFTSSIPKESLDSDLDAFFKANA